MENTRSKKLIGLIYFAVVISLMIAQSIMAEIWLDDVKLIYNNSLFVNFCGQLSLVLFLFPTFQKAYQYRQMETT